MKKSFPLLMLTLLLLGCGKTANPTSSETTTSTQSSSESSWEEISTTNGHPVYHATVINPSTGAKLSAYLELPNDTDQNFSTVILVPGGTGSATEDFTKEKSITNDYLENNLAVAFFDPDGRGESTGEENANGFDQQDGLLAVSLFVAQDPHVGEMGLASYSYGVAMASGMLARYSDTQPFIWYMDWEGPVARKYVSDGCGENPEGKVSNPYLSTDCDDDAFWSEREAVSFLPQITIPYQRLQGADDHVQSSNEHAIDAINAATNGVSPWTRINNEEPMQTYTYDTPPFYFPKKNQSMQVSPDFAKELFELFS